MFVLYSQYVLFRTPVLSVFNPKCPKLNFPVSKFGYQLALKLP
jgi:hypothetical protein